MPYDSEEHDDNWATGFAAGVLTALVLVGAVYALAVWLGG